MPATFASDTSPELLQALRDATREQHVGLEKRMPFFSPLLDAELYLRLLQAYYGFYQPLEDALAACTFVPAEIVPRERIKTPMIVKDLLALGMTEAAIHRLPQCRDLPVIDSPGACLGVIYVLEGATLGGQVLRREVQARLGLDEHGGAAFLDVYGAATGPRWKAFLTHLDSLPPEPLFIQAAAHAADSTFACFERWLDGHKVLL